MVDGAFNPRVLKWFGAFSRTSGVVMVAMAAAVLASRYWSLLTTAVDAPAIRTTSALAFALSGIALQIRSLDGHVFRLISYLLAACVIGLGMSGLLDIGEHMDGFFRGESPLHSDAERSAELASFAIVSLGVLGALVTAQRWLALREALIVLLLAISMAGIASYAFSVDGESHGIFTVLAIHKSVFLLIAALAWMAAEPTKGFIRVASLDSFGGGLARRLMLPALLLPVMFTFSLKRLESVLELPESLALTLAATLTGGTIAGLVWWVASLIDRVERQRHEVDILRDVAATDALTGVANRRALDAALADLSGSRRVQDGPYSLLLLDIDKFKNYNDAFGHQAGDEVLREAGRILRAALRPTDLPARYGGEEFAVVLPNTDSSSAEQVARRILQDFQRFSWPLRSVTVSIGVVEASGAPAPADIVGRADRALFEAKRMGRNQVIVNHERNGMDPVSTTAAPAD